MAAQYLAAAGSIVGVFGRLKEAKVKSEAAKEQARLFEGSAQEILALNEINNQATRDKVKQTKGAAATRFASSGSAVDLESLADIAMAGAKEIELQTRRAQFEANNRNLQAQALRKRARNIKRGAGFAAFSSVLGQASNFS